MERISSHSKAEEEDRISAVLNHSYGSTELTSFQLDLIGALAWLPSDEDLLAAELEYTHITPTTHDVPEHLQLPTTGFRELCEDQPATSPREWRVTFARNIKYSLVRKRILRSPISKNLSLFGSKKRPLHKAKDRRRVFIDQRRSLPNLRAAAKALETFKSHTDHRPTTPEATGPQTPVRPARPKSLFSEREDFLMVVGTQVPQQPNQTTRPAWLLRSQSQSPPQSSSSWANDAHPEPRNLPGIIRPTTPADPSKESRWSPDFSPEKPTNPVKRIFGSLTHSASRVSGLRRMRLLHNKRESSPYTPAPTPAPTETQALNLEARPPGQPRRLRKRVSVMLRGMAGHVGDKSKNQDMGKCKDESGL